jgi:hypothetical protein
MRDDKLNFSFFAETSRFNIENMRSLRNKQWIISETWNGKSEGVLKKKPEKRQENKTR